MCVCVRLPILFVSHWVIKELYRSVNLASVWNCEPVCVCVCEFTPKVAAAAAAAAATAADAASVNVSGCECEKLCPHVTNCKCSLIVMNFLSSED